MQLRPTNRRYGVACVALLSHALLMGSACDSSPEPPPEESVPETAATAPPRGTPSAARGDAPRADASRSEKNAKGYPELLAKLDQSIANARAALPSAHPTDWLIRERLATWLLDRAQLTGRIEDYLEVDAVLNEAFARAQPGSGPLLLAARFNVSIHRLEAAEAHLETIAGQAVVTRETKIAAHRIRTQIAFARGDYAAARAGLEALAAASPNSAQSDLGIYHAKTGAPEEAETLYRQALASANPTDSHLRAWLHLQLAVLAMEHGRYEQALALLQDADVALPGWWLIEEHMAEVHSLLGRDQDALPLYEKVVRETELPQYFDALATVYGRLGRHEEARALVARAGAAWDRQLAMLPEAAMGHGLQHFLDHRSPAEALALAKRNHEARPGGEEQIGLALAYLKADQPAAAVELLETTLKSEYCSADLHDAARQAYDAVGDMDAAEAQRAKCLELNPRATSCAEKPPG